MTTTMKNFTRYNTQDLEALVAAIEGQIKAFNGTVSLRNNVPEIEFTIYTGGGTEKKRIWNAKSNTYSYQNVRKYVGKANWSQYGRIALLPPDRLFDNPIEALANADTQEPVAPVAFVLAVAEHVVHRYEIPYLKNNVRFELNKDALSGARIRINGAVAAKRTKSDARQLRLAKAQKRVDASRYEMRQALMYMRRAVNHMSGLDYHLKGGDVGIHLTALSELKTLMETIRIEEEQGHVAQLEQEITNRSGVINA